MPEWLSTTIFGVTQVFMLVGLLGLIVPVYPGIVIMWLATLGYGIAGRFTPLGIGIFVAITILMLVGTIIDNVLMGAGARQGGATWLSIGVALAAGIVGTLIWPPIGGIIAAPIGVLLLEYAHTSDIRKAWQALRGLATGWGLSFVVRFGIGVLMMILWWVWAWKG
jgi:uncharacterized protein YqgC (DUF456 family)